MTAKPNLIKRLWLDFSLSRTTSDLQCCCQELNALRIKMRGKQAHINAVRRKMMSATPQEFPDLACEIMRTESDLEYMRVEELANQGLIDMLIAKHARLADRKAGRVAA